MAEIDETLESSWRLNSRAWTVVPLIASVIMLIPFFPSAVLLALIALVAALVSSKELPNHKAWVIATSVWFAVVFLIAILGFLMWVSFTG